MYSIYNNYSEFSGNNTTMTRLGRILNLPIVNKIKDRIIGIHAYKFGKQVIDKNLDYILIIGGTDINIDYYDNNKRKIIIKAILQAKYIVTFNNVYRYTLRLNFNLDNIVAIPQSVNFEEPNYFNLRKFLFDNHKIVDPEKIFIMVGNLRKVKEPYYLKDVFKKLYQQNIILVIVGEIIEGEYESVPGIYHIGPLEYHNILSCYKQVDGLINTSISEGMSTVILEAMLYRCPVYARRNIGNTAIINDNVNGFIFDTPEEFIKLCNIYDNTIIENAYNYVTRYHTNKIEKERYLNLIINYK